ncbi:D-glycero-beta-D-manno-heptose 1-phosphate adenylyltransferase [bacterium]|nr:D-glycero-beta-D-manno-heptose 1-phosphate adenylyltransferase [bacterium]
MEKLLNIKTLKNLRSSWKNQNKKVVFTNGCFDIIHSGHIELLRRAKFEGDILVVGMNSDSSVKQIKESGRPVVEEKDRVKVLSALEMVDYVVVFNEQTPQKVIEEIIPDVLVKGSDWSINEIVGREIVESNGGKVVRVDLIDGKSTTNIIEKIIELFCK